jgi:hypothetical protein
MASSTEGAFALGAMTAIIEIALEAVVFPNRFEIDEQEPLSRLEALTEQLIQGVESLPGKALSDDEEVATKGAAVSIICDVSKRIRAAIR